MKFLCPSCKAKYQISDEKVAGRSVRMKCRKCGQDIRVSSADAIASSTLPPPPVDDLSVVDAGSAVSAAAAAAVAEANAAPAKPAEKSAPLAAKAPERATTTGTGLKTTGTAAPKVGATANRPPPRPLTASKPNAPSRPLNRAVTNANPVTAPRTTGPSMAAASAAATGPASGASTAATPEASKTPMPRGVGVAGRAPAKAAVETKPAAPSAVDTPIPRSFSEEFGDEEQTRIADGGALVGAFSAAVAQPAHHVSDPLTMPGDEWFVGINGVPVGPIRLSELRSKASTGSITRESLVWRDGFEEWRPLKSFPELVAIVEESVSSAMASIRPPSVEARPGAPAAAGALADPFAAAVPPSATPSGAVTGAAVVTDDLELAGLRSRPGTGRAAWFAVVVALFFGISVGFVIFNREPQEVVRYVEVPAKTAEPVSQQPVAANQPSPEPEAPTKDAKPSKSPSTSKTTTAGTKPDEGQSKLTGGLKGLGAGVPGAPGSPGGNQSPGGGGSQLEAAQVQQVVSRYTNSVKRSCWQPALDTRDKDAPTSARVVVSIQVGPSGSVQDVTTTGDPRGYRGLANCISQRVRGWQFPPSGGVTPVNVPFVFVAQ